MKRESALRLARVIVETREEPPFEVAFLDLEEAREVAEALKEIGCNARLSDPHRPYITIDRAVVEIDEACSDLTPGAVPLRP